MQPFNKNSQLISNRRTGISDSLCTARYRSFHCIRDTYSARETVVCLRYNWKTIDVL